MLIDFEKPPLLAVIGDPIDHSKSPQMHQPVLDALNINATYIRIHLTEEEAVKAIPLLPSLGFIGINCTIPHKYTALLSATEVNKSCHLTQAVNTLKFEGSTTKGWSTDGIGFENAIQEEFEIDLTNQKIALFGAGGGAGRSVAVHCAENNCAQLTLLNRTIEKIETLKSDLENAGYSNISLSSDTEATIKESTLLVNSTSLGMHSTDAEVFAYHLLEEHHCVYDMVYTAEPNALALACAEKGAQYANGLSMLLHQGAKSFEHWFDQKPPIELMRAGLKNSLSV